MLFLAEEDVHDFAGSLGHGGTGTEDGGYASLVEEIVVLSGDDTDRRTISRAQCHRICADGMSDGYPLSPVLWLAL